MSIVMNRRQVLASTLALALPRSKHQSGGAARAADVTLSGTAYTPGEYPIRAIPLTQVTVLDSFWQPRIRTNAEITIPFEFQKAAERARPVSHNVLQAAIYSLQTHPDIALRAQVDSRVEQIRRAQDAALRLTNDLFEVAAAHYEARGRRDLLDLAVRSADAIYETHRTSSPPFSGGERDAINCIALYRVTKQKRYLDLAKHYLDIRGLPDSVDRSRHNQSHKPVLEQGEAVGHAVNCASLMVSLVEVGILTGIRDYFDAAQRLWLDAVGRKMYITGGIGSTGNEGFGAAYSLPNLSAYAETCAGIMFATLNHLMFLATGSSQYIDVMERALYNNVVDGVSTSGNRFFYVNRLASAGDGRDARWDRASLECCPPNLARFMAAMPAYLYAQGSAGDIFVNLYVSSHVSTAVNNQAVSLRVESEMPWGGRSRIVVSSKSRLRATVRLRVPGWSVGRPAPGGLYSYLESAKSEPRVGVNGSWTRPVVDEMGYVSLSREWNDRDVIEVEFPFEVRTVAADHRVEADRGRIAVERGPIVYCAEGPDCPGGRALGLLAAPGTLAVVVDDTVRRVAPASVPAHGVGPASLPAGSTLIRGEARDISHPGSASAPMTLIPYCLWANRGPEEMSVWLRTREYAVGHAGPAGGIIVYVNPNWAADGWRYLEAAPFDQSAGAGWGCFRREIAGARGTAVGTGRQNTADILAACDAPGTAAQLCASYRLNGIGGWFLPSVDELAAMYRGLEAAGRRDDVAGGIADNVNYWSSSQVSADMARHLDFADNGLRRHYDDKDYPRRVRAVRAF